MDLLNNPLLLAIASAAISALITAAVETAITNRQKGALERQLTDLRHKHALELEQVRLANILQVEEKASQLRLDFAHNRTVAEQRLVKWPKAIAATYKLRYGYLELIGGLESKLVSREQITNYEAAITEASQDMFEMADSEFRELAKQLQDSCSPGPSLMVLIQAKVRGGLEGEELRNWLDSVLKQMRLQYDEIKAIQRSMLVFSAKLDWPSSPE